MGDLSDIDFNDLARRITELPSQRKPGDMVRVYAALEEIKDLPFPPGYLDSIREDMVRALQVGQRVVTYVYLSFYGSDDKASHLKIGIAKNVKSRLGGIKTGNPLTNLWAYSAQFSSREEAEMIEAALLRHMAPQKAHGEWVNVHGLSLEAAEAVVRSLAEVATAIHGRDVGFMPLWMTA